MTPHSTDRAHAISPLDVFGAMAHAPVSGVEQTRAFKAELNKPVSRATAVENRSPASDGPGQPGRSKDVRGDNNVNRESVSAGKKPSARTGSASAPQSDDDDQDSNDESVVDTNAAAAATAHPPSQPQEARVNSGESEVPTEDAAAIKVAAEHALAGRTTFGQPPVAFADAPVDATTQSDETVEGSEPKADSTAALSGELSPAATEPILTRVLPEDGNESAILSQGNADDITQMVPQSPDDPDQNSSKTATDPLVAIDEQTAADAEIQPADASSNHQENEKGNGNGDYNPQELAADPLTQAPLSPSATNLDTQSAAPPPTSGTPQLPQDVALPQTNLPPATTGTQPLASRLPQHVLSRVEGHRGHNPPPVPVDSARFLSRVAKAFLSAQQRDGNEVRLRLSPPELGSLRLQVSVQDGVMVARMETETEAARSSLVNNLPELRERLAEQGIRIERFDIDLMQRPTTDTPDRPSDSQQQNEPQPLRTLRTQQSISDVPSPATLSNWNGNGRLNVII